MLAAGLTSGGVEWVEMVNAVAAMKGLGRRPSGADPLDLEVTFAKRFFLPLLLCIFDLSAPDVPHSSAYRAISHIVDRLGVAHLGTVYTRLGIPASARTGVPAHTWLSEARAQIRKALAGRVGAGTTERCLVYGAIGLVCRDNVMEFPGCIYESLPRGPPAPIGESPEDRSRALIRHVHRHILRDNHAERALLLTAVTAAVRASGDGEGRSALAECVGEVRAFASHIPCVSCVSAFAQFSRFLPLIQLDVAFDDAWRGSYEASSVMQARAMHGSSDHLS